MISFRNRNDTIASTLGILGVIILVGCLYWMTLPLPKVTAADIADNAGKEAQLDQQLVNATKNGAKDQESIEPLLWTGQIDSVTPQVFGKITELVKKEKLKLIALRPQKPEDTMGLTQIPFGITVDGPYTNTMQLVKDLEAPETKLAVTLVQVNSADAATDHVTGTINIAAFTKTATTVAPAAKGGKNAKRS